MSINYSYDDKVPTCEYTTDIRTTQFDDALIQHNVVTIEQVLMSKGMSHDKAQQLLQQKEQDQKVFRETINYQYNTIDVTTGLPKNCNTNNSINNDSDSDDDNDDDNDSFDDDDDEFLQQYKQRRLLELQNSNNNNNNNNTTKQDENQKRTFGDIIQINRTEWQHHVNDTSMDGTYVIVGLLSSNDSYRTDTMKHVMYKLSCIYTEIKFVVIQSHQAIPNWPEENLPCIFIYQYGTLQHELLRLPIQITTQQLEDTLHHLNIL